jgi:hydroxymethylpyrimidine/phosphomethylpyrimidine kinase
MAAKIFYRERVKIGEGDRQPRFKLVAIAGIDMKLYGKHLRKSELKQIAEAIGAELVLLKGGDKKEKADEDVAVYD